ncbi:5694_t:CDS:2 [Entrophospora sp. SA101]|nr:5694_t:CDS:2 [Entrophospora sp. SA101]CAJ0917829.1 18728_t:CDS:2 [Entrophospora sp. SA101]
MSAGLDMSLDDIIAKKRPFTRGGSNRSFGVGSNRGARSSGNNNNGTMRRSGGPIRNSRTQTRHRPYSSSAATANINSITEGKILVSNLAFKVSEADLWELFTTMIGPVRQVNLNFDQNGRSKGTASVVFQKSTDAVKSVEKLRNVTLDGREIKIEIVVAPNSPITQRIGGLNENRTSSSPSTRGINGSARGTRGATRGGSRGGRGIGGRGGARRPDNRPKKTQDELDAEMSEYMQIDEGLEPVNV